MDPGRIGGVFALLALVHFAVDWILQSHDEAMRKHNQWRVRARHCLVYTAPFAAVLAHAALSGRTGGPEAAALAALVFASHFVEDTYLPVLYWAKYVRRPPSMRWRIELGDSGTPVLVGPEIRAAGGAVRDLPSGDERMRRDTIVGEVADGRMSLREARRRLDRMGFMDFVSDPLGKILMIAVDQIVHLVFLVPVAAALA